MRCVGNLEVAFPNHGFGIVREKDFRSRPVPRDHACSTYEIAYNRVEACLIQNFADSLSDFWALILRHRIRKRRKDLTRIMQKLGETSSRRDFERQANHIAE